jgi:hypothetical protein
MRVAYLSTDEVNQDLATRLAQAAGATLCPLAPKDPPPDGACDAVLCDWDFWPEDRRRELLAGPPSAPPLCPLAVHGYGLADGPAEALRRRGVAVYATLQPEVFRLLALAARSVPADAPDEQARNRPQALEGNGAHTGFAPAVS